MKKTNHKNTTIGQYTILNDQIIGRGATSTVFKGNYYFIKVTLPILQKYLLSKLLIILNTVM